jgi:hypothetical protein
MAIQVLAQCFAEQCQQYYETEADLPRVQTADHREYQQSQDIVD